MFRVSTSTLSPTLSAAPTCACRVVRRLQADLNGGVRLSERFGEEVNPFPSASPCPPFLLSRVGIKTTQ